MNKFEKIEKLKKLHSLLETELNKEVKDQEMIKKLSGNIRSLGLTLTPWDFAK